MVLKMQFSGHRRRWGHKDPQRDRDIAVHEKGSFRIDMLVL